MATPAFFNYEQYMTAKLAQVQAGWTMTKLMSVFAENGFVGADGAYAHFVRFGVAEDVAPNTSFNANEYYVAKAAAMGGDWTADSVAKAIADNGMTVLEHYLAFPGKGEGEVAEGATYPVADGQKVPSSVTSSTQTLTVGQDTITGTTGNDIFNAVIIDNQNTLQPGDSIDGGAGHDVLNADLGTSALFAATPEIKNVEVIKFRAQANAKDSGSNNVAGSDTNTAARLDAERISTGDDGKVQLWSQDTAPTS